MTNEEKDRKEYELALLLKSEEDLAGLLKLAATHNAEDISEPRAKRLQLSYEIKGHTEGVFVYITFKMFGDEIKVKPREPFTLSFDLKSVAGLKQLELIAAGRVLKTESYHPGTQETRVDFSLSTERSTWYSLIVEDNRGHKAYSDPIWVDTVEWPGPR